MPTPITTEALVDQLFDLLTVQGVAFDDLAAAKAAAVPIFQNWLGGDNALPAETMRTALNVLGRTNGFVVNQYDFWTTPETGGPYANGDFDALMPDGSTSPQPGLAKMVAAVDGAGAMAAADAATAAAADASAATAAANGVVAAGGSILAAKADAEAAADTAIANAALIVAPLASLDYVGGLVADGDGAIVLGVRSDGRVDLEPGPVTTTRVLVEVREPAGAFATGGYVGGFTAAAGQVLIGFDALGRADLAPSPGLIVRLTEGLTTPLVAAAAPEILAEVRLTEGATASGGYAGGIVADGDQVLIGFDALGRTDLVPSPALINRLGAQSAIVAPTTLNGPGSSFMAQGLGEGLVRYLADGDGGTFAYLQRTDIASTLAMFEGSGHIEYTGATGQSLSVGGGADDAPPGDEVWTTAPRYPHHCLMLNTGARGAGGSAVDMSAITDFAPIAEVYDGDTRGETQGSGMTAALHEARLAAGEPKRTEVFRSHGVGGAALSQIEKGTVPYANGLAEWTKAVEIAAAYGRTIICRAITFTHAETDREDETDPAVYRAGVVALRDDYVADWGPLNPEGADDIVFILDQIAGDASGDPTSAGELALVQLDLARTEPGFYLSTPKYFMGYLPNPPLHLEPKWYSILGEYQARAKRALFETDAATWAPLWPTDIVRTGTSLVVTFHVPEGPLVFDTATLPAATNMGFAYSGAAITDVAITGADEVTITIDADAAGDLSYAYDGPGATGRSGAWGNLRDSAAGISSTDDITALRNWCVVFKEPVA